jgi:hypothetical protein
MTKDKKTGTLSNLFLDMLGQHPNLSVLSLPIVGAIIVFYYCLMIGHYPSGLTVSDSLFFVFVLIAFTITYSFIALSFVYASISWLAFANRPLHWLFNRGSKKPTIYVPLLPIDRLSWSLGSVLYVSIFIIAHLTEHSKILIHANIIAISFLMFILHLFKTAHTSNRWAVKSDMLPIHSDIFIV